MEAIVDALNRELRPLYEEQNRRIYELEGLVARHQRALELLLYNRDVDISVVTQWAREGLDGVR